MNTPDERALERVFCWLNRWGNLATYLRGAAPDVRSRDWANGYERAISDVMTHLEPLVPNWLETWRRENWGYRRESEAALLRSPGGSGGADNTGADG